MLTLATDNCRLESNRHPLQHPRRRFSLTVPKRLQDPDHVRRRDVCHKPISDRRIDVRLHRLGPSLREATWLQRWALHLFEVALEHIAKRDHLSNLRFPIFDDAVTTLARSAACRRRFVPCLGERDIREGAESPADAPPRNGHAHRPMLPAVVVDDETKPAAVFKDTGRG